MAIRRKKKAVAVANLSTNLAVDEKSEKEASNQCRKQNPILGNNDGNASKLVRNDQNGTSKEAAVQLVDGEGIDGEILNDENIDGEELDENDIDGEELDGESLDDCDVY